MFIYQVIRTGDIAQTITASFASLAFLKRCAINDGQEKLSPSLNVITSPSNRTSTVPDNTKACCSPSKLYPSNGSGGAPVPGGNRERIM